MTPADLDILVQGGEGTTLEFKEGLSSSFGRELVTRSAAGFCSACARATRSPCNAAKASSGGRRFAPYSCQGLRQYRDTDRDILATRLAT